MRSRRGRAAVAAALMLSLALVGTAFAQGKMPRLPKPYTFPQTGDSPGKVTFNHASHVNENAPSCTSCHPKVFKILKEGSTVEGKTL